MLLLQKSLEGQLSIMPNIDRSITADNSSNNKNNDNDEVETIGTSDKLQKQKKIEPKTVSEQRLSILRGEGGQLNVV